MAKGKAKVNYLHRAGMVGKMDGPDWSFIYDASTTQDSKWNVGDRVVLPDGRVFRYAKSSSVLYAGHGAQGDVEMEDGIDWALLGVAQAVGDKQVTFAAATHPAYAKDALRGGHILISDSELTGLSDARIQNRGIIGNDASAEDAACVVYLDGPLVRTVGTTTYAFCMPSEYSSIYKANKPGASILGVPAVYVDAADKYFWLQTWGIAWIAISGNLGKTDLYRGFAFRGTDGLIVEYDNSVANATTQYGGFVVDNNWLANGATFMMLQLAP